MPDLTIVTNHQPRDIIHHDGNEFFTYKGELYNLEEFMNTSLKDWDGIRTDTFFSAILVKLVDDGDGVIVGRCYS